MPRASLPPRVAASLASLLAIAGAAHAAAPLAAAPPSKPGRPPAHAEPEPSPWAWPRLARAWSDAGAGDLAGAFAGPAPTAHRLAPEAFRGWFDDAVGVVHVGPHAATTALYAAWARETTPERLPDGRLGLHSMPGMNVSTDAALAMFGGASTCASVGGDAITLEVALVPGEAPVAIDPRRGPDVPGLMVLAPLSPPMPLPVARVLGLHALACAARREARATLLFASAAEPALLRHEIAHALFAGHPAWRAAVLARARALTPRQRDLAVLLAAGLYDVLAPDLEARHPWLVIDEIANAWHDEDPALLDGEQAPASAATVLARLGVALDLPPGWPDGDATLPARTRERLAAWRAAHPGAPSAQALREVHAPAWLWDRLAAQHPATIARLRRARAELVDAPLAWPAAIDHTRASPAPPPARPAGADHGDARHAPRGRGLERRPRRTRRCAARGGAAGRGHP